jgi:hypothetical protein
LIIFLTDIFAGMSFISGLTYLTGGLGILSVFSPILTPLLFVLKLVGINYYTIRNDEERVRAAIKVLQKNTISSTIVFQYGNFFPSGTFIGYNCTGYYTYANSREFGSSEVHILTTKESFLKLVESAKITSVFAKDKPTDEIKEEMEKEPLIIFGREGGYTNLFYSRLRLDVQGLEPKGQQKEIIEDICKIYKEKRRGVFFIHGISGAGKSTIGLLVAKKLDGTFCHSFNPTDPGDTLHLLLRDTEPSDENPTVIVLEEVNTLIRHVNEGAIEKHKEITTLIHNKMTYNTFIDDLILYKNVIIIMTSNEDKQTIDLLDPSYLRKGRVDEYYTMMEAL